MDLITVDMCVAVCLHCYVAEMGMGYRYEADS